MGHWFDCMGYGSGHSEGSSAPLSELCLQEAVQAGPGAYGYFPLLDRRRGFYMQIVLAEDACPDVGCELVGSSNSSTLLAWRHACRGLQVPQRDPRVPPYNCKARCGCTCAGRVNFKCAAAPEQLGLPTLIPVFSFFFHFSLFLGLSLTFSRSAWLLVCLSVPSWPPNLSVSLSLSVCLSLLDHRRCTLRPSKLLGSCFEHQLFRFDLPDVNESYTHLESATFPREQTTDPFLSTSARLPAFGVDSAFSWA